MDLFSSSTGEAVEPTSQPAIQRNQATMPHYQPAEERSGDRKTQELLSVEAGRYDTAKKSNHSEARIPQEIVDAIEAGKATTEMIATLGASYPVYRYRTCLTVHGRWPEVSRERIGAYKNIRQNENGSLEILWTALDLDRKLRIDERLEATGSPVRLQIDSRGTQYTWIKPIRNAEEWNETRDTMFRIVDACSKSGAYCKGYVGRMTFWGLVSLCLTIDVRAIPMEAEAALSFALMDEHGKCDVGAKVEAMRKHKQEQMEKWERQRAENKAEAEREAALMETLRAEKQKEVQHLAPAKAWTVGTTYVQGDAIRFTKGIDGGFRFIRITEKGSFGRYKWEKAVSTSLTGELKWKQQKLAHPKDLPSLSDYKIHA